MTTIRICFVGDSITAGTGDTTTVGWPGRLCAAEMAKGHDVSPYNLGIRGDTSEMIAARWRAECEARLPPEVTGALVFKFGVNDIAVEPTGPRVPLDRSVATARAMLTAASTYKPVIWLGPAPVDESFSPMTSTTGVSRTLSNAAVAATAQAYAKIAAGLGIPFFDLHAALSREPRWAAALKAGDGVHPVADGYALVAELIGGWAGWRAWFER
jgi:acyl-CoA thioesterase I